MEMIVEQRAERVFAGIRMVGPLDQNVGKGFQKLYQWIENNNVPESGDWMAIYYDNPEEVPPEEMRVDTVISVEPDFVLPANSEGVRIDTLKGGLYAVAQAHVEDGDFGRPWMEFSTTCCLAVATCRLMHPVLKNTTMMALKVASGILKCACR